jgi:predicted CXXCH cytochrome family protein
MFSKIERFLIALVFALLAAGLTLIIAQAQEGTTPSVPAAQQEKSNCTECHTEYQMTWMNGPHGQAGSDPRFLADWESQGKPGACLVCHTTGYDPATATWKSDNVSCEACHTDSDGEHPKSPMPTDTSPDLCGRCHSDTRFGWQDWQGSTHYQRGMSCVTCHDPHSASLKITYKRDGSGYRDASQLCISCHQEASMNFPYTSHHKQGVSCVDCHLEHLETQDANAPHTMPDHSFSASLKTCNTCHAEQMHADAPAILTTSASQPAPEDTTPVAEAEATPVTPEPSPVSPIGYAGLAGLVGLAAGMVLAPWLERFYRRVVKHEPEDKNG